jgi:NAD+ diphosphatase
VQTLHLEARHYVLADEKLLCTNAGSLALLTEPELSRLAAAVLVQQPLYSHAHNHFYVSAIAPKHVAGYQWLSLRSLLEQLDEDEFQRAGRALQVLRWHFDHQFCGRCGKPTVQHRRDLAKTCGYCAVDIYPRLSPCIITLVTRGDECLLAWHKRASEEKYSCLAGFIEMGESPEQTLAREVMEEVGVRVNNIRYVASQAWPFPGQLMLGYFADYAGGEIQLDEDEIQSAKWFKYNQLPKIPAANTISGRLINSFVQLRTSINNDEK